MSKDELLRNLGEVARDEGGGDSVALDDRWDRLAEGSLSVEEEAELRALAETDEEARTRYEAFRPLGPEFEAGVVRAIREHRAERGKVLPFRPAWRRVAGWSAAAAAAAAVLVVAVRPPALPGYELAELSAPRATRGAAAEATEMAPGDRFQAVLRPQTAVQRPGSLRAEAFLLREAEVGPVAVESELGPSGSVRLAGTLDPDLPPGTWTLWLVVGRRGALPDPEELRRLSQDAAVHERDWAALPATLRVAPRARE